MVGNSETDITAFFSHVWHNYEGVDGVLLRGSIRIDESQNESQNDGYSKKISKDINNKEISTGGNATAIFGETTPTCQTQNLRISNPLRKSIGNSITTDFKPLLRPTPIPY